MPQAYLHNVDYYNWLLGRVQQWDLKFSLLPRRCFLSNKWVWMRKAYKGVYYITGPGEPVTFTYWIEKDELLLWKLTR